MKVGLIFQHGLIVHVKESGRGEVKFKMLEGKCWKFWENVENQWAGPKSDFMRLSHERKIIGQWNFACNMHTTLKVKFSPINLTPKDMIMMSVFMIE